MRIGNALTYCTIGLSGEVTYGGEGGPCFDPGRNIPIAGKFAWGVGPQGSIQRSSAEFSDDNMALLLGAPLDPALTYANISVNGTRTNFGANGWSSAFVGFSNRYMSVTTTNDGIQVRLQVEVVADAIRFRWLMTNTTAANANVGLWFGGGPAMLTENAISNTGHNLSHYFPPLPTASFRAPKPGFINVPGQRALQTDQLYDRAVDPVRFPPYVNFLFGQTDAFGFRIDLEENDSTRDVDANMPTQATQLYLGKKFWLLGEETTANPIFPATLIPDTPYLQSSAWIQVFPEQVVLAGQSRQILHYVRAPWGEGNYALPFGAVVDAPRLLSMRDRDFDNNPTVGNLNPNPFRVRVNVDNVGGFAADGREFPLRDTRVRITFPANSGISIQNPQPGTPHIAERMLDIVQPWELRNVDFVVTFGEDIVGRVPYTVQIDTQPGNVRKIIRGEIEVAARPRMTLFPDANLVGAPFLFQDSSVEAVYNRFTDPETPGGEVRAYTWDPQRQGYVVTTSVERGRGHFIVYTKPPQNPGPETEALEGNPTVPPGFLQEAPPIQLHEGWNLIANPYNYPFPVRQIIGVSAGAPQRPYTFQEMVELGFISSFLAYWDAAANEYRFIDQTADLQPRRGYWILVYTVQDISLGWPPLFNEFLPDQNRSPRNGGAGSGANPGDGQVQWNSSDKQWRLQISARTSEAMDSQNYIGAVNSTREANSLRIHKPPMAPNQALQLSIEQTVQGKETRLAQALTDRVGRNEWKVVVDVERPGEVTLTWPNMPAVPKTLRFRLTDKATGTVRDLRQTSGYTFRMERPGTREFTISAEPGGAAVAVIGNVVVTRPGRSVNDAFTISYTLSSDANTTVRILSGNGREVATITRGRADRMGENTIVWNLRNSANQAVAPGTYRVEILAETENGDRVRKTVPINVVR
jgi:hypothetical protein